MASLRGKWVLSTVFLLKTAELLAVCTVCKMQCKHTCSHTKRHYVYPMYIHIDICRHGDTRAFSTCAFMCLHQTHTHGVHTHVHTHTFSTHLCAHIHTQNTHSFVHMHTHVPYTVMYTCKHLTHMQYTCAHVCTAHGTHMYP